MNYEPRYTSIEAVPLSGPDDYEPLEKVKALEYAESRLEADVNSGKRISSPSSMHTTAANALATHVLTLAAEDPNDTTIGDLQGNDSAILSYATRYKDLYIEMVDSITSASEEANSTNNVVYTTK